MQNIGVSLRTLLKRMLGMPQPDAQGAQLRSSLCKERDFGAPWYTAWSARIAAGAPELTPDRQAVWGPVWEGMRGNWKHRKLWEWCAIAQALDERGKLGPGKTGLGFAVGQEPLASLFASTGATILASDYAVDVDTDWSGTGQLARSLNDIWWKGLISERDFLARVTYRDINMLDLSNVPRRHFDFVWSACALEHLGTLERGFDFVRASLECLRPGGIAVHTTEYNVLSEQATVEAGANVLYRRRDVEALVHELQSSGYTVAPLDLDAGSEPDDLLYDVPPYYTHGRQHIKIEIDGYVSTSLLLIIQKDLAARSPQ